MTPSKAPEIPIERFEIFADGLDHPECLAFERNGTLWAGGEAGQVYRISSDGTSVDTIAQMGGFCGGLAWSPDESELWICNPLHGVVRVDRSGRWRVIANSVGTHKLVSPNYGVFDRSGSYYVTDSGNWKKHNGWLFKIGNNAAPEIVAGPLGYANGLALNEDGQRLFLVESDTDSIYQIDLATSRMTPFAEDVGRLPDGLALDASGNLYVACYASDDIPRISPTGEKTLFAYDRWAILLSRPTNLAFRDDYLYVANLGRTTITRARVVLRGRPLANEV